jgi:mycothiol synthase
LRAAGVGRWTARWRGGDNARVIRTASRHDLPALRELFARANDAPYALEVVAEEKCFGAGIAGEPVTRVYERGGGIVGAATHCGKWLRILIVARDERRKGIGSALLEDANPQVIAAEPGNYFTPGVSPDLLPFFAAWKNQAGTWKIQASTWNLQVRLSSSEFLGVPRGSSEGIGGDSRGTPRNPGNPEELEETLAFIEREFGRIWRFEASRAPHNLFITREGDEITGFVVHDANNRGLGWFGPTGVARAHRGKGLGKALLLTSLGEMHRQGYAEAVIPWTDAVDFYRKSCGAEPAHRFIALVKQQPIDSAP